jgi:hypothetical protein
MKTILLKSTLRSLSLQNPVCPQIGMTADGRVATYAIDNVPDVIPAGDVLRLASQTCLVNPDKRGYRYNYSDLGAGRIIC